MDRERSGGGVLDKKLAVQRADPVRQVGQSRFQISIGISYSLALVLNPVADAATTAPVRLLMPPTHW